MSKIKFTQNVEQSAIYDLVVCGGGPAGTTAAIAGARSGLKTILVESSGCLGGIATNTLVGVWLGSCSRDTRNTQWEQNPPWRPVIGGIFDEIVERLAAENEAVQTHAPAANGSRHLGYSNWPGHVAFEFEPCKRVLEQMAQKAGVELQYFTTITGCRVENEMIHGVFTHSKSGFQYITGRAFVDATGDADLAFSAGCPYEQGRAEDNLMQAAGMIFVVENVDSNAFETYCNQTGDVRLKKAIRKYKTQNEWTLECDWIVCCEMPQTSRFFINALHLIGVDGTDTESLTQAMINGRSQAKKLFKIMRKIVPGFENSRLVQTSNVVGIRDTRRIIGEYKMTAEDLISGKRFNDTIALSGYTWDTGNPKKPEQQKLANTPIALPFIEIPYRTLVPKTIGNLITAGRCISVDWQALGPIRIMPACFAMGQAAGTAAAHAIKDKVKFNQLNTTLLKKDLKKQGAILNITKHPSTS
jgi:FAD dependent oxidoreductase